MQVIKLAKILRLLRIIKMLRVLKVGELVSRMETIVGKSVVRVLYLMTAAVLVTHIVACLFYYTAFLSDLTVRSMLVTGCAKHSLAHLRVHMKGLCFARAASGQHRNARVCGPWRARCMCAQEDTWVVLSGLEDAGTYERYITALYWSFSTLCTVGYGDVTPGALQLALAYACVHERKVECLSIRTNLYAAGCAQATRKRRSSR